MSQDKDGSLHEEQCPFHIKFQVNMAQELDDLTPSFGKDLSGFTFVYSS